MIPWERRFFEKVEVSGHRGTCWLWKAGVNTYGYGRFRLKVNGGWKQIAAHRLMYEFVYGEIPEGMNVLHKCDTPLCVNPEHLFLGDQQDNIQDAMSKGRFDASLANLKSFQWHFGGGNDSKLFPSR